MKKINELRKVNKPCLINLWRFPKFIFKCPDKIRNIVKAGQHAHILDLIVDVLKQLGRFIQPLFQNIFHRAYSKFIFKSSGKMSFAHAGFIA